MQVAAGALIGCSFGAAPGALITAPRPVLATLPAANIMDHAPIVNIPPFGMCSAPSNPMVIAATAAALGVFTPAPCVPNTVAPWVPGDPRVLVQGMPALHQSCALTCLWGGVIQIRSPGQTKVNHG